MSHKIKIVLIIIIGLLLVVISSKFWGPALGNFVTAEMESWLRKPKTSNPNNQTINVPSKPIYPKVVEVTIDDLKNASEVVKNIKEINANSIYIFLPVIDSEEPSKIVGYSKDLVQLAHKNGLSTGLIADTIMTTDESKRKPSYEEARKTLTKYLAEFARFANANGMVYLQVAGEADNILEMTGDEAKTPELIKEMLKVVRVNYQGEVSIGFDICNMQTPAKCRLDSFNYDITGFDYSSTSIYLSGRETAISDPVNQYLDYLKPITARLKKMAEIYQVKKIYLPINAGQIWDKNTRGCSEKQQLCYPLTDNQLKDFYSQVLAKSKESADAISVPYYAITGPAKEIIKIFYQSY